MSNQVLKKLFPKSNIVYYQISHMHISSTTLVVQGGIKLTAVFLL